MTKNVTPLLVVCSPLLDMLLCDLTCSWKTLLYVVCVHSETQLYLTKLLLVIYGV